MNNNSNGMNNTVNATMNGEVKKSQLKNRDFESEFYERSE